jgi:hypothetical protein
MDKTDDDVAAMGDALAALQRIPTASRRETALRWLVDRVRADIAKLRHEEYVEHHVAVVGAIFGEAQDAEVSKG